MRLIVGLGNPGEKYKRTRHNIGFMVVDQVAKRLATNAKWQSDKKNTALVIKLSWLDVILAKPQTFMNNSGTGVAQLLHFYRIDPSDLIITHDDLDLPFGALRIIDDGSSAGHKGVQSIIEALGTEEFVRLRIGIGRSPQGEDPEKYVLKRFLPQEEKKLPSILTRAAEAIQSVLKLGVDEAQNRFN